MNSLNSYGSKACPPFLAYETIIVITYLKQKDFFFAYAYVIKNLRASIARKHASATAENLPSHSCNTHSTARRPEQPGQKL